MRRLFAANTNLPKIIDPDRGLTHCHVTLNQVAAKCGKRESMIQFLWQRSWQAADLRSAIDVP